jgi:hypothetical protein
MSYQTKLRKWLLITPLLVLLVSSTGCSMLFGKPEMTEVKKAVIFVSANYIRHIVQNNKPQIDAMILWTDYLEAEGRGGTFSKPQYYLQLDFFAKNFLPRNSKKHPLLGLDVVDVEVGENSAIVTFKKFGQDDAPNIEVALIWIGRGWLIVDDSIFGHRGLVAQSLVGMQAP